MNHTNIKLSLASHIQRAKNLAYLGHPYVLGELNSIARQGINGETDVFGDALWLVDFSLWAAAHVRTFPFPVSQQMLTYATRTSNASTSTRASITATPRGSPF